MVQPIQKEGNNKELQGFLQDFSLLRYLSAKFVTQIIMEYHLIFIFDVFGRYWKSLALVP
jgi:hypothetical protein